jgi:hypothetical protein
VSKFKKNFIGKRCYRRFILDPWQKLSIIKFILLSPSILCLINFPHLSESDKILIIELRRFKTQNPN